MGVNGIYGLSGSGMDIESMVKVGMMSKQNEYDKMAQKFTKNEWMKTDYLELSNKITTFNSSTLSQYKMSNTMNARTAESSNSAVKVSANSTAALMSHSVEVTALSSNAYLVGTNSMTRYDTSMGTAYKSTDEGSSSILLKDVLFKELGTNSSNKVYGKMAVVDLDMEDTSRDKPADTVADDGVTIEGAWKFGYTDKLESFTTNWQKKNADGTYSPVDLSDSATLAELLEAQPNTGSVGDWRVQSNGNGGLKWQRWAGSNWYDTDINNLTSGQQAHETEIRASWNAFVASQESTTGDWKFSETELTGQKVATGGKAQDTSVGLSKDTVAFSFEIYDGTQDEAMKDMTDAQKADYVKAHTVSYTYADLMGDGTTEGITFNDLAAKINSISGLNIRATYDAVHDKFSFYNTKSGEDNGIVIKLGENESYDTARSAMVTRNFFNNLGLYQSKNGELYGDDKDANGNRILAAETDAKTILFSLSKGSSSDGVNSFMGESGSIKIDGVTYNDVVDNKITVAGITYTALNKTTDETTGIRNPSTVTVTQDTEGIMEKVKSFVADYNKLLSSLYEKYDEKPNSDYKPLTQSQKDQMKEEQITKWEEKAKAGLLYHDQTLGKVIMDMRSAVSETVSGIDSKYNSIYSLGISTTGLKGQLVLNEDKLKAALAEDPDAVYNIFAKLESTTTNNASAVYNTDSDGKVTGTNGNGIAQRLGDIFVNANKLIKSRAGSSADITEDSDLNNLLRNLQTKMSNFKKLMNSFEDALYKKYDAMESALAKLGMQLNYIMGGQS